MTTRGFETGRPHLDATRLFFSISKLISFKKIKWDETEMEKFSNLSRLHFIFVFIFYFFIFDFFYFYYIKINIFHKK